MGGETSSLQLHFVKEKKQLRPPQGKGHKCQSIPWVSWLDNGNQLCTSGTC